jgi:thiopeptide-type bacteriocin biosynthesis protein
VRAYVGPRQERADELLLDHVRPLLAALREGGRVERYFFLRYLDPAHHVRLRLSAEAEVLARSVRPLLEERLRVGLTDPAASFAYDEYEPEYVKYGGEAGLAVSEAHFEASSDAALSVLQSEKSRAATRAQAALVLVDALAARLVPSAADRRRAYAAWRDHWLAPLPQAERQRWLDYFAERSGRGASAAAAQLADDTLRSGPLSAVLDRWAAHLAETARTLAALEGQGRLYVSRARLAQSYAHLLCNRLGLAVPQEAFLLHLLHRANTPARACTSAAASASA